MAPLHVTLTESPELIAERAGELLRSRIEHNVLATVLDSVRFAAGSRTALFGFVEDGSGAVVAAALRVPSRRLLASVMSEEAAVSLLDSWLAADPDLPGVGGPPEVARAVARRWEQRKGGSSRLVLAEALHTLERVSDPARPTSGELRLARRDERDLFIEWMGDFAVEAGVSDPADIVDRRLERDMLYIWEDEGPVSLVGRSPAVAEVVRIGPVYTPRDQRGRGYASSAVAAVSRAALAGGARRCMLYTDLANPTSNRIYAALGYQRVAEWEELEFV